MLGEDPDLTLRAAQGDKRALGNVSFQARGEIEPVGHAKLPTSGSLLVPALPACAPVLVLVLVVEVKPASGELIVRSLAKIFRVGPGLVLLLVVANRCVAALGAPQLDLVVPSVANKASHFRFCALGKGKAPNGEQFQFFAWDIRFGEKLAFGKQPAFQFVPRPVLFLVFLAAVKHELAARAKRHPLVVIVAPRHFATSRDEDAVFLSSTFSRATAFAQWTRELLAR